MIDGQRIPNLSCLSMGEGVVGEVPLWLGTMAWGYRVADFGYVFAWAAIFFSLQAEGRECVVFNAVLCSR